jgi:hypothetical protein
VGTASSPITILRGLTAAALQQAGVPITNCLAGKLTADNVMADGSFTVGGERYLTDGTNADVQNARALLVRLKKGCARHGDEGAPEPLFTFERKEKVSNAIETVRTRLARPVELPLAVRQALRKRCASARRLRQRRASRVRPAAGKYRRSQRTTSTS